MIASRVGQTLPTSPASRSSPTGPLTRTARRLRRVGRPIRRGVRRWRWGGRRPGTAVIEDSVAEWAIRTGGGTVVELTPGRVIPKIPPDTLEPPVHPRFTAGRVLTVAPRAVVRISGARLEVPSGSPWPPRDDGTDALDRPRIILPDGSLAAESAQGLVSPRPPSRRRPGTNRSGPTCSLLTTWSVFGNYYHWICDVLANLHAVLPVLPDTTRFVVPPSLRPFQVESLASIGIDAGRLDEFAVPGPRSRLRPWRFDDLWFTNLGRIDPDDLAAFRATVRAVIGGSPDTGPRRIYVSRADAAHRRVTNEDAVIRLLAAEGFEVVLPGSLTFAEQVITFGNAEVIVGPHGAGLTNMVFAPPGATIVDLQTTQVDHCFHNLALALGNRYWYSINADRPSRSRYRSDLHVPLDRLAATLAAALSG